MVLLNLDLIFKGTSGHNKRKRDETVETYLSRLTHLYLENRSIDDVTEDIGMCRNLSVLYLYDNCLQKIPRLDEICHLTHLYLQNNSIKRMQNLSCLPKLAKLYLGSNEINVVEGLEFLECLTELHVENQRLPAGEKLIFDPRTLNRLTPTLQILNVSGNNLDSISCFITLRRLTQFMVNDNRLINMREVSACLSSWPEIWRLDLSGNPLCQKAKYRDRIIVMSRSLEVLDGKEINNTSRQFLINWKASKEATKKRKPSATKLGPPHYPPNGSLPPIAAPIDQQNYSMPGLPRKQFQDVLAKSEHNLSYASQYSIGGSAKNNERLMLRSAPNSASSTRQTRLNVVTFS